MPTKGIHKMTMKVSQLCLVLGSSFKEFVEFSLSSAIVKIAITNKTLVKTNISTIAFCQYDFRICDLHYLDQKFNTLP